MRLIICLLLVTVGVSAVAAAQSLDNWSYQPERDRIGRIYYYERSNLDGSQPEQIAVFRRSATEIEVYKHVYRCYNAALVTAELDLETFSSPTITGGRLQPNAQQLPFAFLHEAEGEVRILVETPDFRLEEQAPIEQTPWHLFDFDFGSLTVMTPHLASPSSGFSFGMALVWADESAADPLTWMGTVEARPAGAERHLDQDTYRYALSGTALGAGGSGDLWLDAADGHIVDAQLPVPNHPGYTDFRLRLLAISDGGTAEWTALLTRHFEGCD